MIYNIATGLAIYFVIWWIALFLTLPFGVRATLSVSATPRLTIDEAAVA